MIAKTLFLMKALHSYSVQNLRQEKVFVIMDGWACIP